MPRLAQMDTVAALGLGLGIAVASTALMAQDRATSPGIDRLQDRLSDQRVLFGVQVNREVTENMLEEGRLIAMGGSDAGGAGMACISCHGAEGQGDGSGAFPRLAGQSGWYLYKQLIDYASGARPNAVMSGIAQRLDEQEMEAVSAYYATIEAPYHTPLGEVSGDILQWGGQLAAVGSAERGIPACTNCHGPSGAGLPPAVPYLAGQYSSYMAYQLQLWSDGTRDNDAMNVMSSIAQKMTEEDMQAVSDYFARVRPMARDVAADTDAATPAGED
ncbi:c-type cytochrome [Roseicitreum antarcticum]|uniref:Cytochrome c553 n=1 Tax=Roseicitreum antarcticum TaxID=564137 RepID=A0A1H2VG22_9RHOB|nr:c-type cytochrome [Roseicitreum antarcticum]SDW67261.1 Cytochrome c553 [Roseicitreum antarcticum]